METVLQFIDSTNFGGTEQCVLTLLGGLDRSQWRPVLAYYPSPGIFPLIERAYRLDIKTVAVPWVPGLWSFDRVRLIGRLLRAEQPRVFHAHLRWPLTCTEGLLAAKMTGIPAVVATQHLFVEIHSRLARLQQQMVAAGVHRYIAVSQAVSYQLRETLWRFSQRKVQVVHNGIPLSPFSRPVDRSLRDTLKRGSEQPVVLTIGRLDGQKGYQYLLAAAAQVPDALFVIAGEGPERATYEALVRDQGLHDRVTFLGHRDDIPELLASCDLFVLPSLFEGLPLVVLEAMAAGKPLVASAIGGTSEAVVHGETGLLVPPADPEALSTAIRSILVDPELLVNSRVLDKSGPTSAFQPK